MLAYDFSTAGTKTVTITYEGFTAEVTGITVVVPDPAILYFAADGKLLVGRWGVEVNYDNIAYFKFGGVVGFVIDGMASGNWTITGGLNAIKFNTTNTSITAYGTANSDIQNTLPNIPAFWSTDFNGTPAATPSVSDPSYHNWNNVVNNGKGDPCMLVGYTGAQIAAMDATTFNNMTAQNAWRLPTAKENTQFVGGNHDDFLNWQPGGNRYVINQNIGGTAHDQANYYVLDAAYPPPPPGLYGGWFPVVQGAAPNTAGKYLPAAGWRDYDGYASNRGHMGRYWSSTAENNEMGYQVNFANGSVEPVFANRYARGSAIRCIPQEPPVTLQSLAVISQPSKKKYFTDDEFDITGMSVMAIYSDYTTEPVKVTPEMLTYDFSTAGTKTVTITYKGKTATISDITVRPSPAILYFAADGKLQVGKWGVEVNSDNIAYFKFGGVVGFDNSHEEEKGEGFDVNVIIRFNPINPAASGMPILSYGYTNNDAQNTLPNIPAFWTTDWKGDAVATPSISDPLYHTWNNVVNNGKGDPCMLVGYTGAEIAAMNETDFYNMTAKSQWRLPSAKENALFVGGDKADAWHRKDDNTYTYSNTSNGFWDANGVAVSSGAQLRGGYFPVLTPDSPDKNTMGKFVPAASTLGNNGVYATPSTINGYYWSSNAVSATNGYSLRFSNTTVYPVYSLSSINGATIRCVWQ